MTDCFRKFLRSRFSKIEISKFFVDDGEENFRDFDFRKIFDEKSRIFEKCQKNLKSVRYFFEIGFSIKSFWYFSMIFFLNRSRIFWTIQKWGLEVPRMQRGRVSERNVTVYRVIKPFKFCHVSVSIAARSPRHASALKCF